MGTNWYENGSLVEDCYTDQVGQWQNGVSKVIAPKDKATAEVIFPKPKW